MSNQTDNSHSVLWGVLSIALYGVVLAVIFLFCAIGVHPYQPQNEPFYVEFESQPEELAAVPPPRVSHSAEPVEHSRPAPTESFNQVHGADSKTSTVNPNALFKMAKSGSDDAESVGNPRADRGDENLAKGSGTGLDVPQGVLDVGLSGRGLAGRLPLPDYDTNASGRVIIRVTVDASGAVSSAVYEPQGSTTSDPHLVDAARRAARKARFVESKAFVQGGTITYIFRMK